MNFAVLNQLKVDLLRAAVTTASGEGADSVTLVALARDLSKKLGGSLYYVGVDVCPVCKKETGEGEDLDVVFIYPRWDKIADGVEEPEGLSPILLLVGILHSACISEVVESGGDLGEIIYRATEGRDDVLELMPLSAFEGRFADA